ncbi:uncharacterized protein LOC142330865 [Lycorma delicatula]|uniref:uncharacterized protein LOC142330865 n=1 Tax=Lycorma delicatula TaxID=130591 RepID=UPI003F516A97
MSNLPVKGRRDRRAVNSAPYQKPKPAENIDSSCQIMTRARTHRAVAAATSTPNQMPLPVQNLASSSQIMTSESANTTVTSTSNQTPQPDQNLDSVSQNKIDFMKQLSLQPVSKISRSDFTNINLKDHVDQSAKRSYKSRQDRNEKHKDKPYSRTSKKSSKNAGQSVPQVPPKRIIRKKKNKKE